MGDNEENGGRRGGRNPREGKESLVNIAQKETVVPNNPYKGRKEKHPLREVC